MRIFYPKRKIGEKTSCKSRKRAQKNRKRLLRGKTNRKELKKSGLQLNQAMTTNSSIRVNPRLFFIVCPLFLCVFRADFFQEPPLRTVRSARSSIRTGTILRHNGEICNTSCKILKKKSLKLQILQHQPSHAAIPLPVADQISESKKWGARLEKGGPA